METRDRIGLLRRLKIRWKLLAITLPLVVGPLVFIGLAATYIAREQAQLGVVETSRSDLEHIAEFTLDLLNTHYQQYQVYKEDKRKTIIQDLTTLVRFAYRLTAVENEQHANGLQDRDVAQSRARDALRNVNIGETGYVYVISTRGDLIVHVALEGQNIWEAKDESGRRFIQEMSAAALGNPPGTVHTIVYPWRNELLGEVRHRKKVVAYMYYQPWDWIIAAGSYLEESYEDPDFERRAYEDLKKTIGSKKVGQTGYIYAMTARGELTIHPFKEGQSLWNARDHNGDFFIRTMCREKSGWIRYPWKNDTDPEARMKLVRYLHFEPWDWIVAVGSYEDEFFAPASAVGERILVGVGLLTVLVALIAVVLAFLLSKTVTDPIRRITRAMAAVRRGRLDTQLDVRSSDEVGDLARDFNTLIGVLRENKEMARALAKQERLVSLGVFSSEVAHEINNPLGVILGYASHVEGRLAPGDPNLAHLREIKAEVVRCRDIVQSLLGFTRVPEPSFQPVEVNDLLEQIVSFASNHEDLEHLTIERDLEPGLPTLQVDPDQLRRALINLVLNAGAATSGGGTLWISTRQRLSQMMVDLVFRDNGEGIDPKDLDKVFDPFFTRRPGGTGLGLAISKAIIEQNHGRIGIESRPGEGTTVTVSLPRGGVGGR
ncbi:MAG: cache domain-containing protein [Deltaproteobacteria bacterium]|nr:cache domain-containing protein [Deltaproteobacteria bacterium]